MEVLILGGGVVGVTTAYQLLKDGHQVLVIDRLPPGIGGASYGNAGLIATGHSIAWDHPKLSIYGLIPCFIKIRFSG